MRLKVFEAVCAAILAFTLVTCVNAEKAQAAEFSEVDVLMLAQMTMAEAESEPEMGQRLVIDTILNRIDSSVYPNDVYGVISDKKYGKQFTSFYDGRYNKCYATEALIDLVQQEIENRTNYQVTWFSRKRPTCGNRAMTVGKHTFTWRE